MEAAVCSSALACCSVRCDRSWLPRAISVLAVATLSAFRRTSATTRARLVCMLCRVRSSWATSSSPWACSGCDRSPWAMRSVRCMAWRSALVMERPITAAAPMPSSSAASAAASSRVRLCAARAMAWAWACSYRVCWRCCSCTSFWIKASASGLISVSMRALMSSPAALRLSSSARLLRKASRALSMACTSCLPSAEVSSACRALRAPAVSWLVASISASHRAMRVGSCSNSAARARTQFKAIAWRHCMADCKRVFSVVASCSVNCARSCKRHRPRAVIKAVMSKTRPKPRRKRVPMLKCCSCMGLFLVVCAS